MANGRSVEHNSCAQSTKRWDWARVVDLARQQHWVVARPQLLRLGLSRRQVTYWIGAGRLHRIHPGVYAVGRPPERIEAHWMAATLLGGPAAVISHRSAAQLWDLRRGHGGEIHVTTPSKHTSRDGVGFHRAMLPADEITRRNCIPVTGPFRTILDFAAGAPRHEVERTLHECELAGLTDTVSFDLLLVRHPRRPGTAALRRACAALDRGPIVTRSVMEDRFLAFLDAHDLPRPAMNLTLTTAGGRTFEADCVWRQQRLIVELDGRRFHDSDQAFERDSAKGRALTAAGWTVINVTWRQLARDPTLPGDLRTALSARAAG